MNHGKGSVTGQLIPVEYNRLTVSQAVSIDEIAGGYMEMLEYRNSARGYVMDLEDNSASGDNVARHHPRAEAIRDSSVV